MRYVREGRGSPYGVSLARLARSLSRPSTPITQRLLGAPATSRGYDNKWSKKAPAGRRSRVGHAREMLLGLPASPTACSRNETLAVFYARCDRPGRAAAIGAGTQTTLYDKADNTWPGLGQDRRPSAQSDRRGLKSNQARITWATALAENFVQLLAGSPVILACDDSAGPALARACLVVACRSATDMAERALLALEREAVANARPYLGQLNAPLPLTCAAPRRAQAAEQHCSSGIPTRHRRDLMQVSIVTQPRAAAEAQAYRPGVSITPLSSQHRALQPNVILHQYGSEQYCACGHAAEMRQVDVSLFSSDLGYTKGWLCDVARRPHATCW